MSDDDDLDELLDEVERKFCSKASVGAFGRGSSNSRTFGSDGTGKSKEGSFTFDHPEPLSSSVSDDIDAFLEDLLEDGGDGGGEGLQAQHCPKGTPVERPLPPPGGRRCCPVYLGGSATRCGVGTAAAQRSCDQLRCTTCDFLVLKFDDCRWDVSCDYLFLRNNMPERHKLRSRLKSSSGWRAYACQCSWESTEQLIQLQDRPRLTWVCGGHPH